MGVLPESLAGAPEATRERVTLRCLQKVAAVPAEGEVAAAAVTGEKMLRVNATRSCEEVLLDLIGQVGSPGSFEKDMLPPLSEDIKKIICIKMPTLPETSFELLREVSAEITSMVPLFPMEKSGKNNVNDQSFCSISHDHVNTERYVCPRDSSEKINLNPTIHNDQSFCSISHDHGVVPSISCYMAVQEDKSESKDPQEDATEHSEMFEQKNGDRANLEVICADKANPALQDDDNILKKNTSCGGQTARDSPCCSVTLYNKSLEVVCLSEKNTKNNMADSSVPHSPQDGNKEGTKRVANKKTMGNAVVETLNVHCSDDSSSGFAAACLLSLMENMPSSIQDRHANGSIEDFPEQDLCIKCGKDGRLLKCSSCSLAAHDSCFGSSVTLDVSGQFYCPVCFYNKATEAYKKAKTTYSEARKNLSAFLCTKHFEKQHDERSTGKQPAATSSKYHLNECNTSKRKGTNQYEADNLSHEDKEPGQWMKKPRTNDTSDACPKEDQLTGCSTSKKQGNVQSEADSLSHKDEEPGQQRKKQRKNDTNDACPEEDQLNGCNTSIGQCNHQSGAYNLSHKDLEPCHQKTNSTTDTCTEEVITEKASFGLKLNTATNKDCVLHYKRRKVHNAEHGQPVENAEAREDDNNGDSFYEAEHSSQNRCSPVTSQNVEARKHDGRTNSHECEDSDEIKATSSNDSGKQSSPPWRNMRHHKARLQQRHTVLSNNSKKPLGYKDEHMPSPSRKRNYAYPSKRYSNPLAPAGRRPKLCWTEEEEQSLRDAMLKFTPKDDGPIPWLQILEYGRDVFHKTRLPSDLRVKWRNMKKKFDPDTDHLAPNAVILTLA